MLPEDPRFIGSSLESMRSAAPGLERWLGHVFNVMGGFMVATGAMTVPVACRLLARVERGTLTALSVAGAASVALMSATNFLLYSNFRWLLLLLLLLLLLHCYSSPACCAMCGRVPLLEGGQARQRRPRRLHVDVPATGPFCLCCQLG
ncbi:MULTISPECIES: hypothetical protein [unclassified Variovorax]|uniref:hypothetical protein n=1 Tax=unclassified Variovorax TaxID=663243 RepID=UPI001E3BF062|nr:MULTISPECIES: hypothetical protein [unclassified Variovorax]